MKVGSLVHLNSCKQFVFGIILEVPNDASVVKVFWMDRDISAFVHTEDIDVIRK